jgi:hypothetical protein
LTARSQSINEINQQINPSMKNVFNPVKTILPGHQMRRKTGDRDKDIWTCAIEREKGVALAKKNILIGTE